jgi:hypothetical protein
MCRNVLQAGLVGLVSLVDAAYFEDHNLLHIIKKTDFGHSESPNSNPIFLIGLTHLH